MALNPEQAKAFIEMVKATRNRELTCEECLAEIAELVDAELEAKPLSLVLRMVQEHLEICPCCDEEYRVLQQAVAALNPED